LFSAALIVLLAAVLVWGNCVRCTDFVPVQPESHDCCEKDKAPKPAPMDCAGKIVDFTKATQPDATKALIVLADAGPVVQIALAASAETESAAVDLTLLSTHHSPSNLPLRI
jgi:hypothetical protein